MTTDNFDVETGGQKLDHKQALAHLSSRLKEVLNPIPCEENGSFYKININDSTFPILIRVTFLTSEGTSVLIAHVNEQLEISGLLLGKLNSLYLGISSNSIFVGNYDISIDKINAEIFNYENTKNCIQSINVISYENLLEELQVSEITNNITKEQSNFTFAYRDGSDTRIDVLSGDYIQSIYESYHSEISDTAYSLYGDVPIIIKDPYGQNIGNSRGTINYDLESAEITLDLNLPEPYILPTAGVELGGIKLATTDSELGGKNKIPLQLTQDDKAYVEIPNLDTHRFSDMNSIPDNLRKSGMIILYIGPNTNLYTKGYFYKFTPTNFIASADSNLKWEFILSSVETGQAIADYNVLVDYLIDEGVLSFIANFDDGETSVTDSTLFNIVQNETVLVSYTYQEIKALFKIAVKQQYIAIEDYSDYNMELSIPDNSLVWLLKNVQPMVKVGPVLVYKGPKTWAELLLIISPEEGDFYTVTDRAYQEYYWTGTEWEFMGDIFDPYEAGDGINITSTHDISVKYDNSTIKKDNSGNLYVDGVLTDTQADWTESNPSSPAYINHKPTVPTVNDAAYSVKTDISGTETIVSDFTANLSTADSVTFVQGNNITLTPDSTNKKITIAATDTTYNTATSSVAGLVKSQTTGTTIGRDYNVEVNSNGTMKVNVPWTDTVTSIGGVEKAITTDGTGGSNNIHTFVPAGAIQMYAGSTAPTGWLLCNGNIILIDSNSKSIAQEIQSQSFAAEALDDLLDVIGTSFGSFIIRQSPANDNKYIKNGTLTGTTFTVWSWTANAQQAYLFTTNLIIERYLLLGGTITDIVDLNVISIPDLRETFPVGASTTSTYNLGKTGGEATHALTESEMPRHTHSVIVDTNPSTGQTSFTSVYPINQVNTAEDASLDTNNDRTATNTIVRYTGGSGSTEVAANGVAHNNIPPYLALNFIIKY